MYPTPIERLTPGRRRLWRGAIAGLLGLWLLPLIGVALTSLRPAEDLARGNVWGRPSALRFENYLDALHGADMAQFAVNSLVIATCSVAGTLALSSMAGFALARFRLPGATALLAIFVAGNLVPFQVLMIPVRGLMLDVFGLYDTRLALIVFHIAFQTGFCTLFMRNFFRQLPDALFDAARVDGWGELTIFWRIGLPLVRPAVAAMAALVFTFVWNDFFWSLVLVHSDSVRPVTAGLQSLRGTWLASWQLICAGALLAALPPALAFVLMQRHFVAGLTVGAADE